MTLRRSRADLSVMCRLRSVLPWLWMTNPASTSFFSME